jgi:hypothetical protein
MRGFEVRVWQTDKRPCCQSHAGHLAEEEPVCYNAFDFRHCKEYDSSVDQIGLIQELEIAQVCKRA